MKECRKYEELLARYLHGDALLQDRESLEKHLAMCPDCERTYGEVSDVDRLLRDLPGKQVEPPAHLSARILANLPEAGTVSAWGRWGRWAAGVGAVAACALAIAVALYRGEVPKEPRVASSPPAVLAPAPPAAQTPGVAVPPAEGTPKVRVIQQVKIYFYYPPARKVAVTGDFNDWNVDGVPMQAAGKPGLWTTELRIPPGVYSYNFIVDGELLLPDPNASNQMPDGYGGTNSILLVKGEGEGAI